MTDIVFWMAVLTLHHYFLCVFVVHFIVARFCGKIFVMIGVDAGTVVRQGRRNVAASSIILAGIVAL